MIFLSDISLIDGKEICVSRNNLFYTNKVSSAWVRAGWIYKPIEGFFRGTTDQEANLIFRGLLRIVVHSAIIPEPEEGAFVFGVMIAIGFAFSTLFLMSF